MLSLMDTSRSTGKIMSGHGLTNQLARQGDVLVLYYVLVFFTFCFVALLDSSNHWILLLLQLGKRRP